jgi:hypothetical protein
MSEPAQDMQPDEPSRDGLVQVAVSQRVSVGVAHEHLPKCTSQYS